jgi:hypothetical protein
VPAVEDFELFLLARMSASDLVARALEVRGVTPVEMQARAERTGAEFRLDEIVHAADAYVELLGPPQDERPAEEGGAELAGSTRLAWTLPLWPAVRWIVHRHPRGYAWGERFTGPERVADGEAVRPWAFTADAILPAATAVERVDEWTDVLQAVVTLPAAGGTASWDARFDLGLLQDWRRRTGLRGG